MTSKSRRWQTSKTVSDARILVGVEENMNDAWFVTVGQLYGLEKFWAFLKYYKGKPVTVGADLNEKLLQYRTLDDFRREVVILVGYCKRDALITVHI